MKKLILTAFAMLMAATAIAPADGFQRTGGRKLDAIANGRHYDRLLTPQLNPDFVLDYRAEQQLLQDLRRGTMDLNDLPEPQRFRYDMMLQMQN